MSMLESAQARLNAADESIQTTSEAVDKLAVVLEDYEGLAERMGHLSAAAEIHGLTKEVEDIQGWLELSFTALAGVAMGLNKLKSQ